LTDVAKKCDLKPHEFQARWHLVVLRLVENHVKDRLFAEAKLELVRQRKSIKMQRSIGPVRFRTNQQNNQACGFMQCHVIANTQGWFSTLARFDL